MAVTVAAGHLQAPNEMLKILDSTPNLLQYVLYKEDMKFYLTSYFEKKDEPKSKNAIFKLS